MDYVSAASSGDSGAAETPSGGTACTVTSDVVNVRSGAGTSNAVLTTVTRGASITIVETATVSGALWGRMTTGRLDLPPVHQLQQRPADALRDPLGNALGRFRQRHPPVPSPPRP